MTAKIKEQLYCLMIVANTNIVYVLWTIRCSVHQFVKRVFVHWQSIGQRKIALERVTKPPLRWLSFFTLSGVAQAVCA